LGEWGKKRRDTESFCTLPAKAVNNNFIADKPRKRIAVDAKRVSGGVGQAKQGARMGRKRCLFMEKEVKKNLKKNMPTQ